ncbi:MAG TPA: sulfotransferase domain-containing protein [Candidatus Nanoarchaeia archaeon]|nr:sulfotransferase domain-containing protein [Candidatus Nanoarchaeia archaeon]
MIKEIKTNENSPLILYPREKLIENVLLIEGCSRAGKFLMGNILCGFNEVEHYQYQELIEALPYLMRFGFIDKEAGKALIQCLIDGSVYNYLMGRTLNFRLVDKSCIYNDPRAHEYLQRTLQQNKEYALGKIKDEKTYFPFITHELLPNLLFFFEMYPRLKIIHLERNPVDLVYSWYTKGWGKKYDSISIMFSVFMLGEKDPVPWYAHDWKEEYNSAGEMDRVIKSIITLIKLDKETYAEFTEEQKRKIYCLSYEKLLTETDQEIEKLGQFIGKAVLPEMRMVKAKEMLPAADPREMRGEKLRIIKEKAGADLFFKLMELEKEYDQKGSLLKMI